MLVTEIGVNEREFERAISEGGENPKCLLLWKWQVIPLLWLYNKNTPKLGLLIFFPANHQPKQGSTLPHFNKYQLEHLGQQV